MISLIGNNQTGACKKGFTLLELLLVVLILGIAASITIPSFARTSSRLELRKTTENLANTIRYGQLRAMSKNQFFRLGLDSKGYWLEESYSAQEKGHSAKEIHNFQKLRDRWGRRTNLPAGISLDQSKNSIIFSPDGHMTLANLRMCRAQQCLVVTTGEQRGRVEIIDETEQVIDDIQ